MIEPVEVVSLKLNSGCFVNILFPLDDAYIVQHVVNGLIGGEELRFSDSLPIAGATSPVFVFLVYLLSHLTSVEVAHLTTVIAAVLLYAIGVFLLARASGLHAVWAGLIVLFALLLGHSFYHLLNGLETGLAMAAVVWTLLAFREGYPRQVWHFALLGVLPFIRPELGALGLACFIYALNGIRSRPNASRLAFSAAALAVAGALPFIAFLFWSSGGLIPNTLGAKVYFFAEGCYPFLPKLAFVANAFWVYGLFAGIGILGFLGLSLSPLRWVGLVFFLAFVLAYTTRFPGALYHNHFRYIHVLFPFVVAGWISLLAVRRLWCRRAGVILFLVSLLMTFHGAQQSIADYRAGIQISRFELRGVAEWVARNVPEVDRVLVHDAGLISLIGKQPLVDLVGLKTPSSVDVHRKYTWTRCGRVPEAVSEIALMGGAKYFVVLNEWDSIFRLTDSLRLTGWSVERADVDRGATLYSVYRIGRSGSE